MLRPVAVTVLLALALPALARAADAPAVGVAPNTQKMHQFDVFELTFTSARHFADPLWGVAIDADFRGPDGKVIRIGGFYYAAATDTSPAAWKVRFRTYDAGAYTYHYTFADGADTLASGDGTLNVVARPGPGRLHLNPDNRREFLCDDGSLFVPLGYQNGFGDHNHSGSVLDVRGLEGPFRLDNRRFTTPLPPGNLFATGHSTSPYNGDFDLRRHAEGGFNMHRASPHNNSPLVFALPGEDKESLDHVRLDEARQVDELLQAMHKYRIRNMYGIFGYNKAFNFDATNAAGMAQVRRVIQYSVNRWGAYTDIWDMLNEQDASDAWYDNTVPYLRSIDPYHLLITTSWDSAARAAHAQKKPELKGITERVPQIDMESPHPYGTENELTSDTTVTWLSKHNNQAGRALLASEAGNAIWSQEDREKLRAEGYGGVWDPGSAGRLRVRDFTGIFLQTYYILWETSYAKDGHFMNIWIGGQERQYTRSAHEFASALRPGMKPFAPDGPDAANVRAYGLRGPDCLAVYLFHYTCAECQRRGLPQNQHKWNHDRGHAGPQTLRLDIPVAGTAWWYDPASGRIIASQKVAAGPQTLTSPDFVVDLALVVYNGPAIDTDHDGLGNDVDPDIDNDNVPNAQDAYPLLREEWSDADHDRIEDHLDADADGDGHPDDLNHNGTPDYQEQDLDGDGVPKSGAIPWDAFPFKSSEWKDTDGDGIGDNSDDDIDGDGASNAAEKAAGTDPLNPLSFP